MTAYSGRAIETMNGDGEQTIWAHERYRGSPPSAGSLPMGDFASLVSDSLEHPRRTVYCLTLEVKAQ